MCAPISRCGVLRGGVAWDGKQWGGIVDGRWDGFWVGTGWNGAWQGGIPWVQATHSFRYKGVPKCNLGTRGIPAKAGISLLRQRLDLHGDSRLRGNDTAELHGFFTNSTVPIQECRTGVRRSQVLGAWGQSWRMATTRVGAPLPFLIFRGKQATLKPAGGSWARFTRRSIWE